MLLGLKAEITPESLLQMQQLVSLITVSDALLDYLQDLLEFSRISSDFNGGLSPRAGLAIMRCAQAWSLLHGRNHVLPEDVQAVLPSVISHRLSLTDQKIAGAPHAAAHLLIKQVPVP
jgi:MoxR-like ATPase